VIVLACHAASAAALYPLREDYPHIPFVGIEPAVKPAAIATKSRVIGVLTTQATADGELYRKVLTQFAKDVRVITQVAPRLVELVEAGTFHTETGKAVIADYLNPLIDAGVDQLVLACTHFPFLADELAEISDGKMTLVDPGLAVAKQVKRVLPMQFVPADESHAYFTSGDVKAFQLALQRLIGVSASAQTPSIF
jgi:glutamate racemase